MAELREALHDGFNQLELVLTAQNLAKLVRTYSGEGYKRFQEWIRDVERVGSMINADDARMRNLTLQTLTGNPADVAHQFIQGHRDCTCRDLKASLKERFSDWLTQPWRSIA
ncbi:hypothetical protein SNE40_019999 [Patella caerulea]|uniref:Uncharacterized protein n=1 Tax=Patella caerulea TaxID=87958 RepID=A0AAN8IY41_PATCE